MERLLQTFNIPALECIAGKATDIIKSVKFVGIATLFSASLTVEAQTQKQFDFSQSSFDRVVNRNAYHHDGYPAGYHTYHLAWGGDGVNAYSSVFMHHKTSLNLLEPFAFSAKVRFYPSAPCYDDSYLGQGIVFVLHNHSTSTVGATGGYLGYGEDVNNLQGRPQPFQKSFAIEIDTDASDAHDVGLGQPHLSFLSGGNMTSAISATITVQPRVWYCFSVVWRHANENDTIKNGFYMEVYFNGMQALSQNYESYLDLELDNPNVVWGISSAASAPDKCCSHQIQFISMQNGNDIIIDYPCSINMNLITPDNEIKNLHNNSDCCGIPHFNIFKDTITGRACLGTGGYFIEITGIDMSGVNWYINDNLAPPATSQGDIYKWRFPLGAIGNSEYVIVKAKIDNKKEIVFKITVNENNKIGEVMKKFFEDAKIPITVNGNVGVYSVDQLFKTIPWLDTDEWMVEKKIENILGCTGDFWVDSDSYDPNEFSVPPVIKNNKLTFTLEENVCETEISIRLKCDCYVEFILRIENKTPPVPIVTSNCTGGATLTTKGGNDCSGLEMKWLDKDGKEVVDGMVTDKGLYKLVYFHPDNPNEIIYPELPVERYVDEREINPPPGFDTPTLESIVDYDNENNDNSKLTIDDNGLATVEVDNDDLEGKLYLPELPKDCEYLITAESSYFAEDGYPEIKEGVLRFEFAPNLCETVSFTLSYSCAELFECTEEFAISIKNTDCEPKDPTDPTNPCEDLEAMLAEINNVQSIPSRDKCYFEFKLPPGYTIGEIIHFKYQNYTDFQEFDDRDGFSFTVTSPVKPVPGGPPIAIDMSGSSINRVGILVFNKDGVFCDTLIKEFNCYWVHSEPERPPDVGIGLFFNGSGGGITASYEIPDYYIPFVPIDFYLNDNTGNRLKLLHTVSSQEQFNGRFDFNMSNYPAGIYHISVESKNQHLGDTSFIKQ